MSATVSADIRQRLHEALVDPTIGHWSVEENLRVYSLADILLRHCSDCSSAAVLAGCPPGQPNPFLRRIRGESVAANLVRRILREVFTPDMEFWSVPELQDLERFASHLAQTVLEIRAAASNRRLLHLYLLSLSWPFLIFFFWLGSVGGFVGFLVRIPSCLCPLINLCLKVGRPSIIHCWISHL